MAAKKSKKAKKKATKAKTPAKKFGIDALAKAAGLKPATVRLKLRELKIKKTGKSYGWDTSAEMQAVAKELAA